MSSFGEVVSIHLLVDSSSFSSRFFKKGVWKIYYIYLQYMHIKYMQIKILMFLPGYLTFTLNFNNVTKARLIFVVVVNFSERRCDLSLCRFFNTGRLIELYLFKNNLKLCFESRL